MRFYEQLVSPELANSEIPGNLSSHSIANRSTFHAASSGSHSVKQIAHAGHVDHEKSDVFMTKTGTRTRTEVEGEKSSENPYGLKSENVHDDEIGRKPKIIRIDGEDSDKLSPRSATMLVDPCMCRP